MMMGNPTSHPVRVKAVTRSVPETVFVELTDEELAQHQEYLQAVLVLRSDESSEETRKQAREKLVEISGKMLDADLETRKEEVTTLEKRVTKMRAQFDKRKAAQDQIIDLKMKTIQNEVDGLGGDSLKPLTSTEPLGSGRGYRNPLLVEPADTTEEPVDPGRGLSFGRSVMPARPAMPGIARMGTMSDGRSGFAAMGRTEHQSRPKKAKTVYRTVIEEVQVALSPEELAENQQYESSLKVLKSDDADAAKEAARNTIRQMLVTRFTRDLESREKDLVQLESRVKKLREQLDKRIAARDQIIDLQMTTLQNEIDGLGFDGFQASGAEAVEGIEVRQNHDGRIDVINRTQPARVIDPAKVPTFVPKNKPANLQQFQPNGSFTWKGPFGVCLYLGQTMITVRISGRARPCRTATASGRRLAKAAQRELRPPRMTPLCLPVTSTFRARSGERPA
ncbi:MAG: hypothetical protein U0929_15380 [Planctomycetaceae bacterium]